MNVYISDYKTTNWHEATHQMQLNITNTIFATRWTKMEVR